MNDQDEFEIGEVVDASEVPNWARREPKWQKLIDRIAALKPGKSLTVNFKDVNTARRARNTVRDTINLHKELAVIRTRVVQKKGESAVVYFTRLPDNAVVQEERDKSDSAE